MFNTAAECEKAFYEAFLNADLDRMAQIWGEGDDVRCVHPRGVVLMGRERVLKSFKRIFDSGERMSLALVDRGWVQNKSFAIHSVEEHIGIKNEGSRGKTVCTNVYRNDGDAGWVLVLHHASPLPRPKQKTENEAEEPRPTLH